MKTEPSWDDWEAPGTAHPTDTHGRVTEAVSPERRAGAGNQLAAVYVKQEPVWDDSGESEAAVQDMGFMERVRVKVEGERVKQEPAGEGEGEEVGASGTAGECGSETELDKNVPLQVDMKQDHTGGTAVQSESRTAQCRSETEREPQVTSIETVEEDPEPTETGETTGESGSKTKGSSKLVVKVYICDTCQKLFSDAYHLNRHSRVHTGEKPYTCTICHNKFANSRNLNHHLRIHTGERPYECSVCEKKFTNSSSLHVHERIHTGERPHSCGTCGKQFAQRSTLVLHERTHTGEKPYECKICPKSFIKLANLKLHERSHRGEKPYACKQCDKRFTQSMNLKLHERIHRQDAPENLQQQICTCSDISCDRHE